MLFKKKKKGNYEIKLAPDQFCAVLELKADEVTHKYNVSADANNYNLLYRNGQFLGAPCPYGGAIYPFSVEPRKRGTKRQKKQFNTAKIVCMSKGFNLQVYWGTTTPFILEDEKTKKVYEVGAHGVFFVEIVPNDAGRTADMFYTKCLTQRNATLFNTEELREFLKAAFIMQIGAKIQEYTVDSGKSLENFVGLQPKDILKISEELCPKMKDIFAVYGLSIVEKTSQNSILQGMVVNEVVRN